MKGTWTAITSCLSVCAGADWGVARRKRVSMSSGEAKVTATKLKLGLAVGATVLRPYAAQRKAHLLAEALSDVDVQPNWTTAH
eukprot:39962-Rhodomonas_salina.2